MSTMLTDLMQQLQDVHTYHPGDDGRLMVAVPTTPHTMEQFEVREVHHDGPSVVLYCQPLQDEQARTTGTRTGQAPCEKNPDSRP